MKVKIKQQGEITGVPGLKNKIRTPMEFEITDNNIGKTVLSLIRQGITNFEVEHGSVVESKEKMEDIKRLEKRIGQLDKKVDSLIEIISNLDKDKETVYVRYDEQKEDEKPSKKKSKLIEDDEDDEFIPSVHLDGFEKHGDGKEKVERKPDMEEDVENLSKKLGKKES